MRSSFRLGRVLGVAIVVHWSLLLLLALVTWTQAAALSRLYGSRSAAFVIGLSLASALLFLFSVFLHELAHAVAARRFQLPVRSIALHLLGGAATLDRDPQTARSEFLIAAVGPLTSAALGKLFLLLGDALAADGAAAPVAASLFWLGAINLILAAFNLLPGLPLDGGRVLRAAIWALSGSRQRATRWAASVGQVLGWALIGAGAFSFAGVAVGPLSPGQGGLWLMLVGWFLHTAARENVRQLQLERRLSGISVATLMRPAADATDADVTLASLFRRWIVRDGVQCVPVVDGSRLLGMVSLTDLRKVRLSRWSATPVGRAMTPVDQLAVLRPDDSAAAALDLFAAYDVAQLPVIGEGRLLGMLHRRDLARYLAGGGSN